MMRNLFVAPLLIIFALAFTGCLDIGEVCGDESVDQQINLTFRRQFIRKDRQGRDSVFIKDTTIRFDSIKIQGARESFLKNDTTSKRSIKLPLNLQTDTTQIILNIVSIRFDRIPIDTIPIKKVLTLTYFRNIEIISPTCGIRTIYETFRLLPTEGKKEDLDSTNLRPVNGLRQDAEIEVIFYQ